MQDAGESMVRGFAEAGGAWLGELQQTGFQPDQQPIALGDNRPPPPFVSTGPHGHRRRMRERLLGVGASTLADYEVLEMLLFLGIPRRDTKPLAKALINSFGSLAAVLSASAGALAEEGGLSPECIAVLRLPEHAARHLSAAEVRDQPMLNNWDRLHEYFDTALTGAIPGQLRILFLDNRNRLLADEVVEDASAMIAGLQAEAPDPSRQALRRALDLHATALILVRILAPGPLAKPTMAREAALAAHMTRAASPLAIVLHDHLLIGGENWISLKQKGLV